MWTATVITNDPLVHTNPERDTFYGFHPNPGYDDWYGYFYGDFRGTPGDRSGWLKLLHETYPEHYSWNFATNGWAVHGHVKQYIAYYNWTFGGECGLGRYGTVNPPPYMADQYGWPVVDIYVDAKPPYTPSPRVVSASPNSLSFTWDPVGDQGDGAAQDFFEAGMDHYTSWVTVDGGPPEDMLDTPAPRAIHQVLAPGQAACIHVRAVDRVGNATPDATACGRALATPPMPEWGPLTSTVAANPVPVGLVGLDSWLWLNPAPAAAELDEVFEGVAYRITAMPVGITWDFGDGGGAQSPPAGLETHVFQAHSRLGYMIAAAVIYDVRWSALVAGSWIGPYAMGSVTRPAVPLMYPVQQAQPELVQLGR